MLKIKNTLSREIEEFRPIMDNNIIMFYQCGPTVYSRQHIGNIFSAVKGDIIRRSLEYLGYQVAYTKNVTDVGHLVSDGDGGEDKIEKGAKKEGLTPKEVTEKYTKLYHNDLEKVNVMIPTYETYATEYIDPMIYLVQKLIDKGYAYATKFAIYFEVDKFPDYNKLNRQNLDKNIIGAGHGEESDDKKKKPYDFAIWFFKTGAHQNALQTWKHTFEGIEQPTEEGFPGWHIECSAMARDTLGPTIDIHMGGVEHISVHHTNEIAQSEAGYGQKFANYWLHHEMLEVDGGKMSKSIGNIYTIEDLEKKGFSSLDYRYFLLLAHYRSKQNFTWESLTAAKNAYEKLVERIKEFNKSVKNKGAISKTYKDKFIAALEEDFNIPVAVAVAWDMLKSDIPDDEKYATILDFDRVFGLNLAEVKDEIPSEAQELINRREEARKDKNWEEADLLRDRLKEEFGINVKDKA